MTNLIEDIEKQQLRDDIPEFSSGDTVAVQVRIREAKHNLIDRKICKDNKEDIDRKSTRLNSSH